MKETMEFISSNLVYYFQGVSILVVVGMFIGVCLGGYLLAKDE